MCIWILTVTIIAHSRLRTKTNALIVAQSVANILLQVTILLVSKTRNIDAVRNTELGCIANNVWLTYTFALSQLHMYVIIAVERWISVVKPLHYVHLVTNVRLAVAVTMAYLIALLNGSLPLVWNSVTEHERNGKIPWKFIRDCRVGFYLLPGGYLLHFNIYVLTLCMVVVYFYVHVMLLARKHARQIHSIVIQVVVSRPPADRTGNNTSGQVTGRVYRKARGVVVLLVLICLYVVTKLPSVIYFLFQYDFMSELNLFRVGYVSPKFYIGCVVFGNIFNVIQPYVYMFGQVDIRRIFFRRLLCNRIANENTSVY